MILHDFKIELTSDDLLHENTMMHYLDGFELLSV